MRSYSWLSKIKAVGFDVDGTLYRSNPELNKWFGERLIDVVAKKVGKEPGAIMDEYNAKREKYGSTTLTLNDYGLDGEQVFQDLFDVAPLDKYVLPDGKLAKMLDKLAKKYKLFIISNGTERQILRKLKYLEIDKEMFDPIIACYDYDGWVKPNPSSFLATLEELELAPQEVLYVGDRDETDIEGARGVEMKTAMVWGESELADIAAPTVYDLEKILL